MSNAEAWKRRSIYQVLTDRFAIEDENRQIGGSDHGIRDYCGGTWRGIISKLDYIQGMGFDAIWISPVCFFSITNVLTSVTNYSLQISKNIEEVTEYGVAYHGYWTEDIYSVNPHFGTADDLLALSDALHARGMFLMIDVVVNHMGSPPTVDYSRYVPFNDSSYYHPKSMITNYDNQQDCEEGWLGDGHVSLPDLNTEDPNVVITLQSWITKIVQKFKIDGLRIDTAKHVRKNFWPDFVRSAGVWSLGEVLSGDPDYLSAYQPYIGGLLDYGTYYPLKRAFNRDGGSMYDLINLLTPEYRSKFCDMQQMSTFMENHDMPRFTHDTNADLAVVKNAMAWTLLTDGVPIIYYGQEQSYSGDGDPGSRELMWTSKYNITPLYQYIARLNQIRKLSWDSGFGTHLTTRLYVDDHIAATQKGPLLMVLTNQGSQAKPKKISVPTMFKKGTILVDILTGESFTVKRSIKVTIAAGEPRIFLPLRLAKEICENITPPTQSLISRFFTNLFSFGSASQSQAAAEITSWPHGDPVSHGDIILKEKDPVTDQTEAKILVPSVEQSSSPWSIFYTRTSG
ncbi:glycoside hydrolase family 13 protein [Sclerotinia borealis F-4128]|uniref:Alpha-amylase n=1 Tax=Sclerotinia borealis (strain F-4128) TaxID=1432307 RepID=W9CJ63_SCLBF|nr:glycoside hydrolase family 13 protein [Sclerotinia borealis F-4128]